MERAGHGGQASCQRLSRDWPACTIRTIELIIIERASCCSLRPWSSAARTRSAAAGGLLRVEADGVALEAETDRFNAAAEALG